MLEGVHIGLKVDVDTLRGTREGVPGLVELLKRLSVPATFYFSVGPDNTGRAMRRVFRKGFAKKVARTSVVKHYGIKTLMYGVLLPGPDIGKEAGDEMRKVRDAGFEVGLHTYDHVRWQDFVADADADWTRIEFERGMNAFRKVFGEYPKSHAAAGWQINRHGLELEREFTLQYASDTRGRSPFLPKLDSGSEGCVQLPTTLPTFDELIGRDGVTEETVADAMCAACTGGRAIEVFTLHAELEGMLLKGAFERLLRRWQEAGASLNSMADIHQRFLGKALPTQSVVMAEVEGRSGLLACQSGSA